MTQLIDKKVVLEAVKALPAELDAETVQRCIEVLSNQPTVDAVPVEYILKQIVKLERSKGQSYHAICYRHLIEEWQMENERKEE